MADTVSNTENKLFESISQLIEDSRKQIVKAVNTTMVYTYYGVGQYIVEFEQEGNTRAAYGKGVLKRLSERLTEKYGPGWSYTNLTQFRAFYLTYSNLLTVSENSDSQNLLTVSEELSHLHSSMRSACQTKKNFKKKLSEWVTEFEEINGSKEDKI